MPKSKIYTTRQNVICPVFGTPCEHSGIYLPTFSDVMKHYLFVRQNLKVKNNNKEPSFKEISGQVAFYLENLWKKSSLPSVSNKRILDMLKTYHLKYTKIVRLAQSKKCENTSKKIKSFQDTANTKLFDITSCKCKELKNCSCELLKKVPVEERQFLNDQRSTRKMSIGSIDKPLTVKINKKLTRKKSDLLQLSLFTNSGDIVDIEKSKPSCSNTDTDNDSIISSSTESLDYEPSYSTIRRLNLENKSKISVNLDHLAVMSDKTGVSDRSVATLASSALEGAGLININDTSQVIDRNKVRRARKRVRSQLTDKARLCKTLKSIYFDGRIDTTKVQATALRYVKEEHISLVQEPGSNYLGHIVPITGSAKNISSSIMDFFYFNDIRTNDVIAIGCDGTAVNTGNKGGIICLLEEKLERPLHWFVCLLHANELPLRHLMKNIDGKTTGPTQFDGPISRKLIDCENQKVTDFVPIESENININFDLKDLSTDQQYLLQIYNAVSSGECSNQLAKKKPGKMHHARWLTMANRILRLYVSEKTPSSGFLVIVNYIMKVYVPVWFAIKLNPSVFYGAKHLFKMITTARNLDQYYRTIVNKVVQKNSYFAHPENLLLAMITDENSAIRELGYRRILKARNKNPENQRKFRQPKLILNAEKYYEMIDWQTAQLTEPPVTKKLSCDEIQAFINFKEKLLNMYNFPCHTQAVERVIKLVTDASTAVVGHEAREGYIFSRIEGRKRLPVFETKRDYN